MRLLRMPAVPMGLLALGGLLIFYGLWQLWLLRSAPAGDEFVGPGSVELQLSESGWYTLWACGTARTSAPHPGTVRATLQAEGQESRALQSLSSIERRAHGEGHKLKAGQFFVREIGRHRLALEGPPQPHRYLLRPARADDHAVRGYLALFFGAVLAIFSGAWLLVRGNRPGRRTSAALTRPPGASAR